MILCLISQAMIDIFGFGFVVMVVIIPYVNRTNAMGLVWRTLSQILYLYQIA